MGNIFKYLHRSSNLAKTSYFNLCEISIPHPQSEWITESSRTGYTFHVKSLCSLEGFD